MLEASSYYKWRPHPWHGLEVGPDPPAVVNAFIEITPFDTIKYETDKRTGYVTVDRPQAGASLPPTCYGFVPRTFCGGRIAALSAGAEQGDEDPLDVCVISERPVNRAEVILRAKVVGAIRTIDEGRADDKIVAVLRNDAVWGQVEDMTDLPEALIQRLKHYFLTYKSLPEKGSDVSLEGTAGAGLARRLVEAAMGDYLERFAEEGDPAGDLICPEHTEG